jgi:hypothetical protein
MTEEPTVFGDAPPFTLVHGDDLNEVTRFLSNRGVTFNQTTSAPSLYKLQFMQERADTIQKLMRELFSVSLKGNPGSAGER